MFQVHNSAGTLDSYNNKERSPSVSRTHRKVNLVNKRPSIDNSQPVAGPSRSPTSPIPLSPACEIRPKSILKKSNSNIEQGSVSHNQLSPTNSTRSNSWVAESPSLEKKKRDIKVSSGARESEKEYL